MRLSVSQFNEMVQRALDTLPSDVEQYFANVAVVVADVPTPGQMRTTGNSRSMLLGLYEGVPRIAREGRPVLFPDRITLFQKSLEVISPTLEELQRNILVTLWHEIGHHLGFADRKLRTIERRILERVRLTKEAL